MSGEEGGTEEDDKVRAAIGTDWSKFLEFSGDGKMNITGNIRWLSRGRKSRQQRFGENACAANAAANRFGGDGRG